MSTKQEKGFSVVEGLLVLLVVILLGFIGWLIWSKQTTTSTTNQASTTTPQASAIEIKEWGVKLNTSRADDFTYEVHSIDGTVGFSENITDSSVSFNVKPALFVDSSTCGPDVGWNLFRLKGTPKTLENTVKVGDRYYMIFGAPGICGNDTDTELMGKLRGEIDLDNLEKL